MNVLRRSYRIEVCRVCGFHLSNGATPTGRCEHRDHWGAGGIVVEVVPDEHHRGAVGALERIRDHANSADDAPMIAQQALNEIRGQ